MAGDASRCQGRSIGLSGKPSRCPYDALWDGYCYIHDKVRRGLVVDHTPLPEVVARERLGDPVQHRAALSGEWDLRWPA